MIPPPIKKRVTAITNGCADVNPIFVAAEADAHRIAKRIPAAVNFIPDGLNKILFTFLQTYSLEQ